MAESECSTTEKRPVQNARETGLPRHKLPAIRTGSIQQLQSKIQDAASKLYQSTVVEFILRRKHLAASNDGRHIPLAIEHDEPLVDTRRGHSYISNDVRTSRYNVWDFIPKQLIFQFTRVGNFYFLCVGVPQMVSQLILYLFSHMSLATLTMRPS